jgi:hypothetical protein
MIFNEWWETLCFGERKEISPSEIWEVAQQELLDPEGKSLQEVLAIEVLKGGPSYAMIDWLTENGDNPTDLHKMLTVLKLIGIDYSHSEDRNEMIHRLVVRSNVSYFIFYFDWSGRYIKND